VRLYDRRSLRDIEPLYWDFGTLPKAIDMNVISVIIGIVALIIALIGFVPLLGWLNWFVIPGAVVGLVIGLMSKETTGRNINIVVLALAIVRLALGGGIL
jgi:hypothetical protein